MADFDLAGVLRRVRRRADLSQRELAGACQVAPSTIAHVESGRRGLTVAVLAAAAAVAGLRLALIDDTGTEVPGMRDDAVRDVSGRRFPAHLDTLHSDDRWWRYEHRFDRPRPWFTFDRVREGRDAARRIGGTPEDHHEYRPGDSPQERKAQRQRELRRRTEEERQRRADSAGWRPWEGFACSCLAGCDELDLGERPLHAAGCPCRCDLG